MTEIVEKRCREQAELRRTSKSVDEAPDRIADLLEEAAAEISRLKAKCNKQTLILRHMSPDKSPDPIFFISGASYDTADENGLPSNIFVCPAYGCDWSVLYRRTNEGIHPEW